MDPQHWRDPCWERDVYDQGSFNFKHKNNKQSEQKEADDKTTDSPLSEKLNTHSSLFGQLT